MNEERIREVAEQAQEAFWAKVADQFPEITTGDFPPDATFAFDAACEHAVTTWYEGNLPDPLGTEAHHAVVDALRARGWTAHHEYPGMIGVSAGPFVLNIGMHAWDYGTPGIVLPLLDPDTLDITYAIEPFETAPELMAGCGPEERNAETIAEAWDFALRGWLEEQHVKAEHIPTREEIHA